MNAKKQFSVKDFQSTTHILYIRFIKYQTPLAEITNPKISNLKKIPLKSLKWGSIRYSFLLHWKYREANKHSKYEFGLTNKHQMANKIPRWQQSIDWQYSGKFMCTLAQAVNMKMLNDWNVIGCQHQWISHLMIRMCSKPNAH